MKRSDTIGTREIGGGLLPITDVAIPALVLDDRRLSCGARVSYAALASSIANHGPRPVPIRPAAERVGVTRRTASGWIRELSAAGHIDREQRPGLPGVIELLSGGGPADDPKSYIEKAA